jgi:protein-tyrosine phosphatase
VLGYIDLHSHYVVGIDDGVKSIAESRELLVALRSVGFSRVVATPHMRPGMFDNDRPGLERAYARTLQGIGDPEGLPELGLASEHYFDDVVFERMLGGDGLPYPGGRAALLELPPRAFPARLPQRLLDLKRRGVVPVIAHPERYEPVWKDAEVLEALLDVGAVLQLDVAALDGKYGRAARKAAELLLDEGFYGLASSDAHKPSDVEAVARGIERLHERAGGEEARYLLVEGPLDLLEGRLG